MSDDMIRLRCQVQQLLIDAYESENTPPNGGVARSQRNGQIRALRAVLALFPTDPKSEPDSIDKLNKLGI